MELFGWQGRLDSRETRGELLSADRLPAIQYVEYDETLFGEVADAPELDFLAFAVNLQEKPTPPATSQATEVPGSPAYRVVGWCGGGGSGGHSHGGVDSGDSVCVWEEEESAKEEEVSSVQKYSYRGLQVGCQVANAGIVVIGQLDE